MNLRSDNHVTTVTLSERNVRDMLAQYEAGRDGSLHRRMQDGTGQLLTVRMESDEKHYADREDHPIG